ncbi:MAG: ClpXP protease specificity-enhancing factor SspB, partial [Gammaproteobacteria bacterium]
GQPQHVSFPASAVIAIYARETGQGMMFGDDEPPPEGDGPGAGGEGPDRGQRPNLKVVK